jgi:hypothetical protein
MIIHSITSYPSKENNYEFLFHTEICFLKKLDGYII